MSVVEKNSENTEKNRATSKLSSKKHVFLLFVSVLFLSTLSLTSLKATETGTLIIPPSEDTHVDTFRHTLAFGDQDVLIIAREQKEVIFQTGWNHKDALLKFDLYSIPSDLQILSVKLYLYCEAFDGDNVRFQAYHCSSNN